MEKVAMSKLSSRNLDGYENVPPNLWAKSINDIDNRIIGLVRATKDSNGNSDRGEYIKGLRNIRDRLKQALEEELPGEWEKYVNNPDGKYKEYRCLAKYIKGITDESIDSHIQDYYGTTDDRRPSVYKAINGLLAKAEENGEKYVRLKGKKDEDSSTWTSRREDNAMRRISHPKP